MAIIIDAKGNEYLLTIDKPETEWIKLITDSLGMTKEAVVGAAVNKGLIHYVTMLRETDEHDNKDGLAEGNNDSG